MLSRLAAAALLLALAACSESAGTTAQEDPDTVEAPEKGACRLLSPSDIAQPSNATEVVDCSKNHTAETFLVDRFPKALAKEATVDDPRLGAHIYRTCNKRFQAFLGGDESTVMRSILTWAWFRPSEKAWEEGARWYRCDAVGGTEESEELLTLPKTVKGLLEGRPDDDWMTCAIGETVSGSEKVPCSEPHDWRAATTIKVGRDEDPYPGDRLVEDRTRDYCSDSVGAWLNYPVDYEFGYTYFRKAEWKTGNRRSICWARTDE